MIFVVFVTISVTVVGTSYLLPFLAILAPGMLITFGIIWLGDITGWNAFLVSSWSSLSGFHVGDHFPPECPINTYERQDPWAWAILVVLFAIVIGNLFMGWWVIYGIPASLVMGVYGTYKALRTRDTFTLRESAKYLMYGTASIVGVGVALRVAGLIYTHGMCVS